MRIFQAGLQHLDDTARLFDLYRQFYDCPADFSAAREFIQARLDNQDSLIFLLQDDSGDIIGFSQIYPSFCSVEMIAIGILYDLYIDHRHRASGLGRQMMQHIRQQADSHGMKRLDLLTGKSNVAGQKLYEYSGYRRSNEDFYSYSLMLNTDEDSGVI